MTNPFTDDHIREHLFVGSDAIEVEAWPDHTDMLGGAGISIKFCVGGYGYGITHELIMGADDWARWKQAVDEELKALPVNDN